MNTPCRIMMLLMLPVALSGCMYSKYKSAPKNTPPAIALNLASAPAPGAPEGAAENRPSAPREITAILNAVIVYRGPGSWKRDAYWDEYVLTLTNQGQAPLFLDSAVLTDLRGERIVAGAAPWSLESESRGFVRKFASSSGDVLMMGGGAVAATAVGVLAGTAAFHTGGTAMFSGLAGALGGAMGGIIAAPVYAGATIYQNITGRHNIEAEFQRRRIALPAVLAPNRDVSGSFFFRITPGPKALALQYRSGGEKRTVAIDLTPLARLHLKADVAAPAADGASK